MGRYARKKQHKGDKPLKEKYRTRRKTKDLDQIHEDMIPKNATKLLDQDIDLDKPGSAQFYCLHCALFNSIKKHQLNVSATEVNETASIENLAQNLSRERARLFGLGGRCSSRASGRRPSSSSSTRCGPKRSRRSWTFQFFCLSSVNKESLPTSSEKEILNKANLGLKKIVLFQGETESEVTDKLMSEEGFPKLKNAGGFELLRCHASSRTLILISCKWNADDLKKNVNPQANIYLRPIQKNLSIEPIVHDVISEEPVFSIRCMRCEKEFNARSLRLHLLDGCTGSQQQEEENCEVIVPVDDSDDLPSLDMLEEHTDRVYETDDLPSLQRPHRSEHVPEQSSPEISNALIESDDQTTMGQRTEDLGRLPPVLKEVVERIIKDCKDNNIVDPVEILRKVQLELVTGRPLEVEDISQYIEGETNFITVDRSNLLATAMDEVQSLSNLRPTLEVQFYNEIAVDYGGPRKEFFRLMMHEIKNKYFDNGLRELLSDQYIFVGNIFALSIVQNGPLPCFMDPQLVEQLFADENTSACITNLIVGLDTLGLYSICKELPSLKFLFQNKRPALTVRSMIHMLKPKFSEEGSNNNTFEKTVYAAFLRYLRNVASGRRNPVTLQKILQFTTGADEEPVLGFILQPTIEFSEVETSFLPTANTCISSLRLPRPSINTNLPVDDNLFTIYDYAFTSEFYGLK